MKNYSNAVLKEPIWLITILAGLKQITRPNLLKWLILQISLNLAIFGKNWSDFWEKNYVSIETIPLWILDSWAVHYLEFLFFSTYKLDWILNSSSSNVCLWLQTIFNLLPSFDLESLRTETALFLRPCKLKLDNKKQLREITTAAHIWTIFVPVAERTLETLKLQTRRIY